MSLFQGLLAGLATVVFIGPVLFYLLSASLEFGVVGGVTVAIGIIVSDIAVVWICYNGLAHILSEEKSQIWLSFIGAVILIAMGVWNIWFKKRKVEVISNFTSKHKTMLFSKGFLINFVNPFVFAVWIGFLSYAEAKFANPMDVKVFIMGVLLGIFCTDITKVFISKFLQKWLSQSRLLHVYRLIGILMMAFGVRLIYHGFSILHF